MRAILAAAAVTVLVSGVATAAETRTPSGWWIDEQTDPITDEPEVILVHEEQGFDDNANFDPSAGLLALRCKGGTIDAFVIWPRTVSQYSPWMVTSRIDSNPPKSEPWAVWSSNNTTVHRDPEDWIAQLLTGSRVALRTVSTSNLELTLVFDLTGLTALIPRLAKPCNWTP